MRHQPTMTDEKKARIYSSVQFLAVMAEMIKMEYLSDLVDAHFKNPLANQFAKRIGTDARAIQLALKQNDRVNMAIHDNDFVEEYAAELWQLFHFFIGLPISQIKEIMAGLNHAKIEADDLGNEHSDLWQAIYDTIDGGITGAELGGDSRAEGIKNATDAIMDMVGHSLKETV